MAQQQLALGSEQSCLKIKHFTIHNCGSLRMNGSAGINSAALGSQETADACDGKTAATEMLISPFACSFV